MPYPEILIPLIIFGVGVLIHLEVGIATLKVDIKWIKKRLDG